MKPRRWMTAVIENAEAAEASGAHVKLPWSREDRPQRAAAERPAAQAAE